MPDQDISGALALGTSSVDDAAQSINASNQSGIPADAVTDNVTSTLDQPKQTMVSPVTAAFANKSSQHASMLNSTSTQPTPDGIESTDADKLNWFEKAWQYAGNAFRGQNIGRQVNELAARKADGEQLSEEDSAQLYLLNQQQNNIQQAETKAGFSKWVTTPIDVASGLVDTARVVDQNAGLIAGSIGTTAAAFGTVGAIAGAAAGGVGAIPGALAGMSAGAEAGLSYGALAAFTKDAFRQGKGGIYNSLDHATQSETPGPNTPNSVPYMAETEKRQVSQGAAGMMAIAGFASHFTIAKTVPWMARALTPQALTGFLLAPENAASMSLAKALGSSSILAAVGNGSQAAIQSIAENMRASNDGTPESITSGIYNAIANWKPEQTEAVTKAAAVGVGIGVAMHAGGMIKDSSRSGVVADTTPFNPPKPAEEAPVQPKIAEGIGPTENNPISAFRQLPNVDAGVRALQLRALLQGTSEVSKSTNVAEKIPDDLHQYRADVAAQAGVPHVWIDTAEARDAANTPEKGQALRSAIDVNGARASQLNAPVQILTHDFQKVVDVHPDLAGLAKLTPQDPSAIGFVKQLSEAEQRRNDILEAIPKSVRQDMPESSITDQMKESIKGHQGTIDELEIANKNDNETLAKAKTNDPEEKFTTTNDQEVTRQQLEDQVQKRSDLISDSRDRIETLKSGLEPRTQDEDIFNQGHYLDQPTFTDALKRGLSSEEVERFNKAHSEARQGVIDAINADAESERQQVIDVNKAIAFEEERQKDLAETKDNPDVQVVEDFLGGKHVGELDEKQQARQAKGKLINAIDPRSMSKELRNQFKDDEVLKRRKVFARDGQDINNVVEQMGVKDPSELLSILSSTPTREESANHAVSAAQAGIDAVLQANVPTNKNRIAEAFNKMTKNNLEVMKIMLEKNWPATKSAFKRLAFKLPKLEEIEGKARAQVADTAIKDLNANQWRIGASKSFKNAMDAGLNAQWEKAFTQKEAETNNIQLEKETRLAIKQVNRDTEFVTKTLLSSKGKENLAKAGPTFENAINGILDLYRFGKPTKETNAADALQKFAKRMVEKGQGNYDMSDFQQSLDTKQTANDLTVDQYKTVVNQMRAVYSQALLKNRLVANNERILAAYEAQKSLEINDVFRAKVQELAEQHPTYDENRAIEPQGKLSAQQRISKQLRSYVGIVKNLQSLTTELDSRDVSGTFAKLLLHPVEGIGDFQGTGQGLKAVDELMVQAAKVHEGFIRDTIGEKEFKNYANETVNVPEWQNNKLLNGGKQSKLSLLEMLMHMGNDGNRDRFENFGVGSAEQVLPILERELPKEAFDLAQKRWNMFSSLGDRIVDLEKNTTGRDVELVNKTPFTAHGTEYEGGYYPIKYDKDSTAAALAERSSQRFAAALEGRTSFVKDQTTEGIVKSLHTKERTGNPGDYVLDLSPYNFAHGMETSLYDLGMRVPVMNGMKLLTDKGIAGSMIKAIGQKKFDTLVNSMASLTNSQSADTMRLYAADQKAVKAVVQRVQSAQVYGRLAFSIPTMLKQAGAIPISVFKAGPSVLKHVAQVAAIYGSPSNWGKWAEFNKAAGDMDAGIGRYQNNLDAFNMSELGKQVPKENLVNNKAWSLTANASDFVKDQVFRQTLGRIDTMYRVVMGHAIYNQFTSGDVKGFEPEVLAKMSDADIDSQAQARVHEILEASFPSGRQIDKSSIQRHALGQLMAPMFNEGRNILNFAEDAVRSPELSIKSGINKAHAGDLQGAQKAFNDAGSKVMLATGTFLAIHTIESLASGRNPGDEDEEVTKRNLYQSLTSSKGLWNMVKSVPTDMASHIPIASQVIYGMNKYSKDGTVDASSLFDQQLGNLGTGLKVAGKVATTLSDSRDFMNFTRAYRELNSKELEGTLSAFNMMTDGALPAHQLFKYIDWAQNSRPSPFLNNLKASVSKDLNGFVESVEGKSKPKTDDESLQEMFNRITKPKSELDQAVNQSKVLLNQIKPLTNQESQ